MDFKQINEDLISLVEKTIDPKFRDAIKRVETDRKTKLQNKLDKTDPDWTTQRQRIRTGLNKVDPVRKIYKELAAGGMDVEASTIEFIGKGSELNAKNLKQILKDKMDKEDYNNGPNRVNLIMDSGKEFDDFNVEWQEDETGIAVWQAYYKEGKFFLDEYTRNAEFTPPFKGRILMAELNSQNKWLQDNDFYIAYGKSSKEKRDERAKAKEGSIERIRNKDSWFGYNKLDKSGYNLTIARNDLKMRLKDYKKNNGTYTKQVEELTKQLDELLPQVNDVLSHIDFNQGIEKPQNVMKAARKAAVAIKDITSSADSQWYDDSSMKRRVDDAKEALNNLKIVLE